MNLHLRLSTALAFAVVFAVRAVAPAQDAPPAAGDGLSSIVRDILGSEANPMNYRERTAAIRRLPSSLRDPDVDDLKAFAFGNPPPTMRSGEWHSVVNDLLDVLLHQEKHRSKGLDWLTELARGTDDPVLRDYAIQKIPLAWRFAPEKARGASLQLLEETARSADSFSAGTSLIVFRELSGSEPDLAPRLNALALSVADNDAASPAARTTALQICAAGDRKDAAPAARRILASENASVAARIGAVAALGRLGTPEDRPALQAAAASHPALKVPAEIALRHLSR